MFLVKGVKLQGVITWFDNFSVLLRRDGRRSYLQASHPRRSCRPPADRPGRNPRRLANRSEKKKPSLLQEVFTPPGAGGRGPAPMFLVNASCCQGELAGRSTCSACCCQRYGHVAAGLQARDIHRSGRPSGEPHEQRTTNSEESGS
jgi:hypothetical protein